MAQPAAVLSILLKANTGPATTGILRVNQSLAATEKGAGRAERSTNKALSSMARGADRVAGAFENVAKVLAFGGAVTVAGGLAYSVKQAAEFEQQLSSLGAVADTTGKQMGRLRKQALKAGADTKFSALEAAQAQTELAKGGLSVNKILRGGLNGALALAAAGEMDLADAASTTANALNLFKLRGKQAGHVADVLATAANKTTGDVSDFALALTQGGAAAKAVGYTLDQTVAFLEALADAGVKGSDAGTSMKTALVHLANPVAKTRELMDKLRIKFFDANGEILGLSDMSVMLRDRLKGLTKEQKLATLAQIAGTDGVRGLLAIMDAGPKKLRQYEKGLAKQGTAAEVAKKKQDNLKGSLEQLQGSVETLGIQIGTGLLPYLRTAADELTKFANKVSRIFARDDLTLGEKLQRSLEVGKVTLRPWIEKLTAAIDAANIPERLAAVVSTATPLILKGMAVSAVAAAKTFVGAFASSDAWGKLALGTFLIRKLGLGGMLTGGLKGGGGLGGVASMAKPVPVFVTNPGGVGGGGVGGAVGGGAAGGAIGKVKGVAKGAGKLAGKLATLDFAINLVDQHGNPIAATINTAHDLTFGILPKVDVKTSGEKKQGQLAGFAKQLDEVTKGRDLSGIKKITTYLKGQADEARRFKDENLAKQYDDLAAKGTAAADQLSTHLANLAVKHRDVAGMADRFAGALRGLRIKGSKDFDGLVHQVTFGSKQILKVGGEKSKQTQEAIGHQFDIARRRIREHFRGPDGVVHMSKAGLDAIHQLAVKELGLYGISAGRVNVVLAKGANGQMRPHARGGPINEGKAHGDSVPALLERGEYVINRKAVNKVGRKALDHLNFGQAPRFQSGGMVDPAWDPGNERLAGSISGRVGAWAKRFQANMTAGFDPGGGHVSPGHNLTGTATDMVPLAGNWDLLEKGLRLLTGAGLKVLYGSNGVGTPWPNHGRGNHAHIEWGGAGGIPGLAMFNGLARVALKGPASVGLEAGQGVLDRVRGAANAAINSAVMFSGEGGETGSNFSTVGGGKWQNVMAQIAKMRHWSLAAWQRLVQKESGGDPTARNSSSGAFGLGQFLGKTAQDYAKYGALSTNGSDQIRAMAQYISDRYGNPSAALAFHNAHNWYSKGGSVGMAAGGLFGGLGKTLGKVAKHPRRHAPVKRLLDRIGKAGLSPGTTKQLGALSKSADTYGEFAGRAEQLGGMVGGRTQDEWLTKELEALFKWRNALIKAHEEAVARRAQVINAIAYARMAQGSLKTRIAVLSKHPKKNRALLRPLRAQFGALGKLIPALTGKRSALTTARGDILTNLETVQGLGAPSGVLKTLPAVGVLGGRIFDTQMALKGLGAESPTVTDADSERSSLLDQLLREANLRTAVSEKQFQVFKDMPQFATGGIVPGPSGAAVPAIVHGGEGVFRKDQMAAMGASNIVVIVQDGAVDPKKIRVIAGQEAERISRTQSRNANRGLPGRGGGGIRG